MILETACPSCNAPVVAELPDDTNEADAAMLAPRIYCAPCAALRVRLGASVASNPAETLPEAQDAPQPKQEALP